MTRSAADPGFESLLEFIRDNRGFDFTGYKRSTLGRRVRKRMDDVGAADFAEYRRLLERDPDEFTQLFDTILINVTAFWRDPESWESLSREHLPRLLAARAPDAPIRVWSAGCASGEETYTLVMVLAEALGTAELQRRVKVYATDVDDHALAQARGATYSERAVEGVPPELLARYFVPVSGGYVFRSDLRRSVIFGRHDLVRDAPISHLDLLVSRNTLMYFTAETQTRILTRFHFALNDDGLLFLGKAEMMRSHGSLFSAVDLKSRIFQKVARADLRERLLLMGQPPRADEAQRELQQRAHMLTAALNASGAAHLVVDGGGTLALANARARELFGLAEADVGRPLQDLTVSYRPVELRSLIDRVRAERKPQHLSHVEHPVPDGRLHSFDVAVCPLSGPDGAALGVSVSFVDVTPSRRLQAELQEANQELETAFEELQSTNEELETTNEELQSTIEELETTNEELQSTNEELETMNEELQSTNEELETINDELQRRTGELNEVNAYMGSILTSLRAAVVVVDRGMDIRIWNRKCEDLWGLRADEVQGHALQNLDIGLPVERLKSTVRACIEGRSDHEEVVLDAVNRRGRAIHCRIGCTPLVGVEREIRGAVLVMEEWRDGTGPDAAPGGPAAA